MPPHRVGFLRRFGLKTSVHFAHIGLESSMVFEGTTGVYKLIYRFNSKWVRKKWEFEMDLKNFGILRSAPRPRPVFKILCTVHLPWQTILPYHNVLYIKNSYKTKCE